MFSVARETVTEYESPKEHGEKGRFEDVVSSPRLCMFIRLSTRVEEDVKLKDRSTG